MTPGAYWLARYQELRCVAEAVVDALGAKDATPREREAWQALMEVLNGY